MDVKIVFNYKRIINNSDIVEVDGRMRLAIRDKEIENVLSLFSDRCRLCWTNKTVPPLCRARLHKNNYQHKTVKVVDRMLVRNSLSLLS